LALGTVGMRLPKWNSGGVRLAKQTVSPVRHAHNPAGDVSTSS
jgi:hypothetical protein